MFWSINGRDIVTNNQLQIGLIGDTVILPHRTLGVQTPPQQPFGQIPADQVFNPELLLRRYSPPKTCWGDIWLRATRAPMRDIIKLPKFERKHIVLPTIKQCFDMSHASWPSNQLCCRWKIQLWVVVINGVLCTHDIFFRMLCIFNLLATCCADNGPPSSCFPERCYPPSAFLGCWQWINQTLPCGWHHLLFSTHSIRRVGLSGQAFDTSEAMDSSELPLEDRVEEAYQAGARMARPKMEAGAKIYHVPLKFKVSEPCLYLSDQKIWCQKSLCWSDQRNHW